MLEQLRLGHTFTEIGALHDIHPTRVKKIILAEIERDQRLLNQALVLTRQVSPSILLSAPLQKAIGETLRTQHFDRADVNAHFRGCFSLLLQQPGISFKHLRELRVWIANGKVA